MLSIVAAPVMKKEEMQTRHHVLVHSKGFKEQPQGYMMGKITNDLKKSYSEPVTTKKILEYFGNGHSIMLANAETDEENHFRFLSSSLFAIDVDDVEKGTDPVFVMQQLKDRLTGLFYTFSHNKKGKGNRYRLVFQLDKTITVEEQMKGIIELVAHDLQELGIPVDTQAKNPLQIVRGGKKAVFISDKNKLNTTKLLERVKEKNVNRQKELYDEFEKELRPVPFESLVEMAETIGHIPSGVGQGELWKRLVVGIKHYVHAGFISNDEGFELFDIISGGEQSQRAWETLRSSGKATIKSFIYEAKNRGYKGKYTYYSNQYEPKEDFEKEVIRVKEYIPVEVAKELLGRKEKILVDSPTGSGKTTAFLDAFKELAAEKRHIYIFAAPTIALTLQNAQKHHVMAVKGQTADLFRSIHQYVKSGKRVFIATYDMAPILVEILKSIEKNMTYSLVVDELHKFVTDYNYSYRYKAINNLYQMTKEARSFIGLSGTVDDIFKNEFSTVVRIDNGKPQSPCSEFAVYTYEKKKDALSELTKLIEVWSSKRKLLIYIQSKKKIDHLKHMLRRKGIKVRAINANSKSNPLYKDLVEKETITDDIQVVLTTSVIADGVNIKNTYDWEVIAVANDFSNLFNYSAIKQISNRLRNPYVRFSLFMQEPKNENQDLFNLEAAYRWRIENAERITKEINDHPYFDAKLFQASLIEQKYGIYLGMTGLEIDKLFLRHSVSREQESYFAGSRFAFINAVERALHVKHKGLLNISKEIREKRLDLALIESEIEALEEKEKEEEALKAENISNIFTKEIYEAFKSENESLLKEFKEQVLPIHYACLNKSTRILDYKSCEHLVSMVKRDADTHAFYNQIKYVTDAIYLLAIHRPNKTKSVLKHLLKLDWFMTNAEYKENIEKISKKTKLSQKDVKEVEKLLSFENERENKTRYKRVKGTVTIEDVSKTFDLDIETVRQAAVNYAALKGKTFERVIQTKLQLEPPKEINLV